MAQAQVRQKFTALSHPSLCLAVFPVPPVVQGCIEWRTSALGHPSLVDLLKSMMTRNDPFAAFFATVPSGNQTITTPVVSGHRPARNSRGKAVPAA